LIMVVRQRFMQEKSFVWENVVVSHFRDGHVKRPRTRAVQRTIIPLALAVASRNASVRRIASGVFGFNRNRRGSKGSPVRRRAIKCSITWSGSVDGISSLRPRTWSKNALGLPWNPTDCLTFSIGRSSRLTSLWPSSKIVAA
jgi:hypothetical protein